MRVPMPTWLSGRLIERALRTPYFHLQHADGSDYMRRFWLMPLWMLRPLDGVPACDDRLKVVRVSGLELRDDVRHLPAMRLHNIRTPDYDRHLHDHPWSFVSIVLMGGYTEIRPVGVEPAFDGDRERTYRIERRPGDVARRLATDRHRIVEVLPDTWTLFITGPKRQWWGFYTEIGKVHWRAYESVHNAEPS